MLLAQWTIRDGVHARCFWWAFGMCAALVVWRPRSLLRACAATRWPRKKTSTVAAVKRSSTCSWTRAWGTE